MQFGGKQDMRQIGILLRDPTVLRNSRVLAEGARQCRSYAHTNAGIWAEESPTGLNWRVCH